MHPIYLQSVCRQAESEIVGSRWVEITEEAPRRFRLRFEDAAGDSKTLCLALGPRPWFAGATRRRSKTRLNAPAWSRAVRSLLGAVVQGVARLAGDRVVEIRLDSGACVQLELIPQAALICILDSGGLVRAHSPLPKRARTRVVVGGRYERPDRPPWPDPFEPRFLDSLHESHAAELQRDALHAAGFRGTLLDACLDLNNDPASQSFKERLASRLAAILQGTDGPVLDFDESEPSNPALLWPWMPTAPPAVGMRRWTGSATRVAAKFLELRVEGQTGEERGRSLRSLLLREQERFTNALGRARGDRKNFEAPLVYQQRGESLLAALDQVERAGDKVRVANVHDPSGARLEFIAAPDRPLHEIAGQQFEQMRRAERGIERAEERIAELERQLEQVDGWLLQVQEQPVDFDALEAAMRGAGLPVGLAAPTRKGRAWQAGGRVRVEGVRLYTSKDGFEILVGKSAKENQRLTFRLAGPEDFWLHAQGVPGAHVVVRNPERLKRLPAATLTEAAQLAAWFSEARSDTRVDVQYTTRKLVRKIRGAAPGAVQIKRFETLRVVPRELSTDFG